MKFTSYHTTVSWKALLVLEDEGKYTSVAKILPQRERAGWRPAPKTYFEVTLFNLA